MNERYATNTGQPWPLRPFLLAVVLGIAALGVHFALEALERQELAEAAWRQSLAAFLFFGGLAFAVSVESRRAFWAVIFATVSGITVAGITWWVSGYSGRGFEWNWAFASGVFALVLATPLFQAARDGGGWQFPYKRTHFHVWTDAVVLGLAAVFTGIAWSVLALLAGLFELIGIEDLSALMRDGWFVALFSGVNFGAALGIARENSVILGSVQRVLLVVLSILAPPLALGLSVFLLLLLFTGLDTLWDSTKATTPIVLSCAIGAFILANAVFRNEDDASESRLLNLSALLLGLCILPLAVIAAISMGLRIDQYGQTPDRLWGLVAVIVACGFGFGYAVAIIRHRRAWAEALRSANTRLAISVCGLTLFLALPIMDFGGLSTRNQVARLQSGLVEPVSFDWAALRFDFGPKGRAAVARLSRSKDAAVATQAKLALKADSRYDLPQNNILKAEQAKQQKKLAENRARLSANMQMVPEASDLRTKLLEDPAMLGLCNTACVAVTMPNGDVRILEKLGDDRLQVHPWPQDNKSFPLILPVDQALKKGSSIEVRKIEAYQIVIDGKPLPQLSPAQQ